MKWMTFFIPPQHNKKPVQIKIFIEEKQILPPIPKRNIFTLNHFDVMMKSESSILHGTEEVRVFFNYFFRTLNVRAGNEKHTDYNGKCPISYNLWLKMCGHNKTTMRSIQQWKANFKTRKTCKKTLEAK